MRFETIAMSGSAGFPGAAIARALVEHGCRVVCLDAPAGNPAGNGQGNGASDDLLAISADDKAIVACLHRYRPDAVIHLASPAGGAGGAPLQAGVARTFALLDAVRAYYADLPGDRRDRFRLLHVSPEAPGAGFALQEQRDLPAAANHRLLRVWRERGCLPMIQADLAAVYGPGQEDSAPLPALIHAALDRQLVSIPFPDRQISPWLYCEDVAAALLVALNCGQIGGHYRAGGAEQLSELKLARWVCSMLDRRCPGNAPHARCLARAFPPVVAERAPMSAGVSCETLGWQPHWRLEAGLAATVNWILDCYSGRSAPGSEAAAAARPRHGAARNSWEKVAAE